MIRLSISRQILLSKLGKKCSGANSTDWPGLPVHSGVLQYEFTELIELFYGRLLHTKILASIFYIEIYVDEDNNKLANFATNY